ncbi:O-sialoglycoprotein endopeptidase [Metallumcola ferriviriculae]|uniref:N(6)-L-threonylcarbamoyladenine synthase n=1 Tax=Metallumcola ferriviriculae TaxID=3039180 RepID=A0AAU0UP61_9FIRM|nr:O-sialoglycoprotein endopeptidase [Desulfitibacteraceae bacterium MK1]
MYSLGIDTSCYTTSVAVVDRNRKLIFEDRRLLAVPPGERGLQQSQAVFQHVQNLPIILENVFNSVGAEKIAMITASTAPRPTKGSYMPVFTVSQGQGKILASALDVPFIAATHQEGHLEAALWSTDTQIPRQFLAVHLSGGTSELLLVSGNPDGYAIKLLGGTIDLHAGQFVDRIGVALGFGFPAGAALETLARQSVKRLGLATAVKGYEFSFSGPESQAQRLIAQGAPAADVARSVEQCIATTLEKVLRRAIEKEGIKEVLLAGGVAANGYIRKRLMKRLHHPAVGASLVFAKPDYSTDNAVGVALLGLKQYYSNISLK